jgi:hypothetical protein
MQPMASNSTTSDVLLRIDPANGNRLTIQSPNGAVDRYEFSARTCDNPLCGCSNIDLLCTPLGESKDVDPEPHIIALDVLEESPQEHPRNEEQINVPLTRIVAAGLNPEQWRRLRAWFVNEKRRAMEDIELDSLEPSFPSAVTKDGMMLAYEQVFPFAERLTFSVDEQLWVVDDQYCVQPNCDCIEAILCLFPRPWINDPNEYAKHIPLREPVTEAAAIRYNTQNSFWEAEDDPPISRSTARKLMTALEKERPDLPGVVAERRRQLRYLYLRSTDGHTAPHSRPVTAAPKIGRNQPCTCGSGKKYKHCCGR